MTELKRGRWSTPELVRLRGLFPKTPVERIARTLNRSASSVRSQAHRLFRRDRVTGPWNADQDRVLRQGYGVVELGDLAVILGRSPDEVRQRSIELRNARRNGSWSGRETARLKALYPGRSNDDLEVCLSRSAEEIECKALELCLRKDKGAMLSGPGNTRMPRWTREEIEQLRQLYPTKQNLEIAREIGRSVTSVANKAHQLGLKKSDEIRRIIGAENAAARARD